MEEIDYHLICAECGKMLNSILHTHKFKDRKVYHEVCFYRMRKRTICPICDEKVENGLGECSKRTNYNLRTFHVECYKQWVEQNYPPV